MDTIQDRRELPFFQVRLDAIARIHDRSAGPRRLRAIGFYALLCQLANEQRHTGEHRRVTVNYDELARRGQMSKRSVKALLDILLAADVIRYELIPDTTNGTAAGILHLLVHDGAWTPVTVAMADRLAQRRDRGHLLRDLGLVVVLLEFCGRQRDQHGGLRAEVARADIAARTGLTIDSIDDCNRILEHAGVLQINRRRAASGGRNLASVYTVIEAANSQGRESVLAGRQNGTGRAENGYSQGGESVLAGRENGTGRAESGYSQGGDSATGGTEPPPSNAPTGSLAENIENNSTPSPQTQRMPPPSAQDGGGGRGRSASEDLCEALLAAWDPALGDTPRQSFIANRRRWLNAAAALVERHPRERLDAALAYMVTDEILGSEAITMPGFAKVADKLIARAHARRTRTTTRQPPTPGTTPGLGWPDAKVLLERSIQRHGRDGRDQALAELTTHTPLFTAFVERVRWGTLCEQPLRYAEHRYAELWDSLPDSTTPATAEKAAA